MSTNRLWDGDDLRSVMSWPDEMVRSLRMHFRFYSNFYSNFTVEFNDLISFINFLLIVAFNCINGNGDDCWHVLRFPLSRGQGAALGSFSTEPSAGPRAHCGHRVRFTGRAVGDGGWWGSGVDEEASPWPAFGGEAV